MGFFDLFGKPNKRAQVRTNQQAGKKSEEAYRYDALFHGKHTERTGRGSDFKETKGHMLKGKQGRPTYVEVKSGGARLSPLQKETQKKKRNYRVERRGRPFW